MRRTAGVLRLRPLTGFLSYCYDLRHVCVLFAAGLALHHEL